jgi:hypothetical protein
VNKGIGCESCHGRIDQMPLTAKAQPLQMAWCLGCHQAPERAVRPRDQIYTFGYRPAQPQNILGPQLVREYHILGPEYLTACSTCHR